MTRYRALRTAFFVYALAVAWLTFQPSAGSASWAVTTVQSVLDRLGAPGAFTVSGRIEFLLNVAMLTPLPILGTLVWPRTTWRDWTAYAFAVSACVETVQGLFIPSRDASVSDIAANTTGGAVGGILIWLVLGWLRTRRTSRD